MLSFQYMKKSNKAKHRNLFQIIMNIILEIFESFDKQDGIKGPKPLTWDTKEVICSVQPKISFKQMFWLSFMKSEL